MALSRSILYPVQLSAPQREDLETITSSGRASARKIRRARVLLLSDHGRLGGRLSRTQVAQTLDLHVNSVDRIRKRFFEEGEAPALNRRPRLTPPTPPKLDGAGEAHLVAICCSAPPSGRIYWTLQLLADELIKRRIVTHICAETVRQTLKKTNCSLGASSAGVSPNATAPASWRRWKTSSMSTRTNTPRKRR